MDEQKAEKLIKTALRTIKIVELLVKGVSPQEVTEKVRCNRQLVEYYKNLLNEKRNN